MIKHNSVTPSYPFYLDFITEEYIKSGNSDSIMTILLTTTIGGIWDIDEQHTITIDTAVSEVHGDCFIIVDQKDNNDEASVYNVATLEKALYLYGVIIKKLLELKV